MGWANEKVKFGKGGGGGIRHKKTFAPWRVLFFFFFRTRKNNTFLSLSDF